MTVLGKGGIIHKCRLIRMIFIKHWISLDMCLSAASKLSYLKWNSSANFLLSHSRSYFPISISSIIRPMSLKAQLNASMIDAMKSGDEVRKRTVRMALAAVKQVEVDKRIELDDTAVMNLLQKEVKNRREALEEAKTANRADLIEANEAEIKVLQAFLPQAMPAEELRALVQSAITETGAASPTDMGKVMKVVMAKVAGRAPNDMVSATVRELLQK